jgi:superfamily II DNA or RNA helicase/Zn ribbon nucleic-acid-binding protein
MWSARLDLRVPSGIAELLRCYTGVPRETIVATGSAAKPLLLPLRQNGDRNRSTWLQFCPRCLAGDEAPYFCRHWRLATRISCFEHGCGLRDRCPACRAWIAAFDQAGLTPQHFCVHCGFNLREAPKVSAKVSARRLERSIDDVIRVETAKGWLKKGCLVSRLLRAELHPNHVGLPRGCLDDVTRLIRDHGGDVGVEDRREPRSALSEGTRFLGAFRGRQIAAREALAAHDFGVLAAATAFGKTVVAAALIAERARNTLVLVHRRELLTQWVEQLKTFLAIDPRHIGIVGGGRRKPTGMIDVALIQILVRRGEVSDLVADYGHLVVDECHHLSAASFELVARRAKAKYVLGLSATVVRNDGHHPIIFMQCGSVRYRANAREQTIASGLSHRVLERPTRFQLPPSLASAERPSMPAIYAALAADDGRNDLIFDDVLRALEAKRSPVVLTERRDHLELLQARFAKFAKNLVVLRGGMSAAERKAAEIALRASDDEERLILATGRYLGEGFDDPRLTMPIAWKGTLAQYVGRLHREHRDKAQILVYDYVDATVPVLARMAAKRRAGYRALGYRSNRDGRLRPVDAVAVRIWSVSRNNAVASELPMRAAAAPRARAAACTCAGAFRSAHRS